LKVELISIFFIDYCKVRYLKAGAISIKVSKKVTAINKILMWNVKSNLIGEWVDLTDYALDYISIDQRKLVRFTFVT